MYDGDVNDLLKVLGIDESFQDFLHSEEVNDLIKNFSEPRIESDRLIYLDDYR